jgi:hypothetical protein
VKVWISPCPGVGLRGFRLWKRFGFSRYLYRDLDGKCRKMTMSWASPDLVWERS